MKLSSYKKRLREKASLKCECNGITGNANLILIRSSFS